MKMKERLRLRMERDLSHFFGDKDMEYISHVDWETICDLEEVVYRCATKHKKYGKPKGEIIYTTSNEFEYFSIVFPYGNKKEWKELELDVYGHSKSLVGKIAVTCIQGLVE